MEKFESKPDKSVSLRTAVHGFIGTSVASTVIMLPLQIYIYVVLLSGRTAVY
jgi:hypothetical protein